MRRLLQFFLLNKRSNSQRNSYCNWLTNLEFGGLNSYIKNDWLITGFWEAFSNFWSSDWRLEEDEELLRGEVGMIEECDSSFNNWLFLLAIVLVLLLERILIKVRESQISGYLARFVEELSLESARFKRFDSGELFSHIRRKWELTLRPSWNSFSWVKYALRARE